MSPTTNSTKRDRVLLALLLIASATIVCLAWWIRQLQSRPRETAETEASPVVPTAFLESVGVANLQIGRAAPSAAGGWILYLYTPTCDWCSANRPAVQKLARELKEDWAVLAMDVSNWNEAERSPTTIPGIPSVVDVPDSIRREFLSDRVPKTLVYAPDWRLVGSFSGAYRGELATRLKELLRVDSIPEVEIPTSGTEELPDLAQGDRASALQLCLDDNGLEYSLGKRVTAFGMEFNCSPAGAWRAPQSKKELS